VLASTLLEGRPESSRDPVHPGGVVGVAVTQDHFSTSPGERSIMRIFSTIPSGVVPVSKSTRCLRPSFLTTSAPKPCWTTGWSKARPPSMNGVGTFKTCGPKEGRLARVERGD
jgi:hypothetical protein